MATTTTTTTATTTTTTATTNVTPEREVGESCRGERGDGPSGRESESGESGWRLSATDHFFGLLHHALIHKPDYGASGKHRVMTSLLLEASSSPSSPPSSEPLTAATIAAAAEEEDKQCVSDQLSNQETHFNLLACFLVGRGYHSSSGVVTNQGETHQEEEEEEEEEEAESFDLPPLRLVSSPAVSPPKDLSAGFHNAELLNIALVKQSEVWRHYRHHHYAAASWVVASDAEVASVCVAPSVFSPCKRTLVGELEYGTGVRSHSL
jgi:hypothetical protein